jgi:chemosensory pili system protein ChpA (sensor histidine kinase/response regulator)
MDKEQQIRINFLDEAEDCFDRIESVLLGLADKVAEPQQLDLALRAAHSVKGGAGMMGFTPLNQIAHRLEDFLKILRVRYHSTQISPEVEILLLKGVDSLRQVSDFHRQGTEIDDSWLSHQISPIFEQLRQKLGDLQDRDEDTLFNQNQQSDSELLMFEEQVETILDQLEAQLGELPSTALSETLVMTAEQLMVFSQMANLEPFTQLCQSVQQQAAIGNGGEIESLARQALATWRRSHALVSRRSLDKLPSQLEIDGQTTTEEISTPDWENEEGLTLEEIESSIDLTALEAELANVADQSLEQLELTAHGRELAQLPTVGEMEMETDSTFRDKSSSEPILTPRNPSEQTGKMVRVPVEQLYQFNNLFGKLILERNTVNLRLEQLRNFALLMRQRMHQLEQSNTQLRKWYDRASLEGIVPVNEPAMPTAFASAGGFNSSNSLTTESSKGKFDTLEMDRYTDLHLISQEQIETIVQLEEVTKDIEIGLQEMTQVVSELNQTTRALQGNVTRTQMLPFADVVKRFPRVIRDFSLQFGKQVNLKIEGETTLIDRAILDSLNAPLTHLLRNAFDHGIEDPATRVAAGKPPFGTITLQAVNRGTQTLIAISDDGAGIPLDKIPHRLREMGISPQEIEQMSKREILNYIFEPGFSTSDEVTELSGRGVGMDVVRTNLQDIRGDIQVQTKAGQGTTFTISVPFTLSILRVMILERAGIVFAVTADSVREMLRLPEEEISSLKDLEQLSWNQQTIPAVRLEESLIFNRGHKPFKMQGNPVINKPTAIVVGEGTRVGAIYIDRFWSEQEVSIRPIESPLPLPLGFISSMVLGDGRVIPLVDPVQILQGSLESYPGEEETDAAPVGKDLDGGASQEQVKTILIVDDSIAVRRYLALTLEKAGYQVEQAKDGQEAVDKLFGGLSVQAVICDLEMPRLDGYGVLEEVKAKPEFQNLPMAMLTSRSNEKHRKLAMNLGASAYFFKPYNPQQLLQDLQSLLE